MTGKTPQALLERPTLAIGLDIYLIAYHDLLHDRQIGMDIGTIPWSSIYRWGNFHGVTDTDDLSLLVNHIRALEKVDRELDKARPSK